mgnify:FL=1|jgi:hypothetical protein|tara:strand:- start:71 stop:1240 length:1170 start_codon:yes stop_codon:yes gene_type:complete
MAVNKFFHDSNKTSISAERNLYKNLIKEAIQIHGHDVYYVNRTFVNEDTLFGEDTSSTFSESQLIEMYVENAEGGLEGEKELVSKFGLDIKDEVTFVVSKERFQDITKQVVLESGTTETFGAVLLEDETTTSESAYLVNEDESTDADRPLEGDLVFHPIINKMFEISFVDHDEPFFQLDNNPVYKLKCRLFEYGSEGLDTGVSAIDQIETDSSLDALSYQFTLEQTGTYTEEISLEDNDLLLLDRTDGSDSDAGDNLISETQFGASSILLETADTYYITVKDETGAFELDEVITGANGGQAYIKLINSNTLHFEYITGTFAKDEVITGRNNGFTATITEMKEENHYLINEEYNVDTIDEKSQIEDFENLDNTILDFSESNPFGDAGKET